MAQKAESSALLVDKIKSQLQENVTVGGISVAIASAHSSLFEICAGQSDITNGNPIKPTQSFGIGSITKVFVAVVIFQLIEEGSLTLSDTVSSHLDAEVYKGIPDAESATIEQLLSHTAGIDSWEDNPSWIIHGRGKAMVPSRIWSKTEPLDYIRRPKQTAPSPGSWYYSNTHYTFLGLIIEKVTQNTAEAEIRRRILEPLDMKNTFTEGFEDYDTGEIPCRYQWATTAYKETAGICPAFPQVGKNLIEAVGSNLSLSWMAGGMFSSASDLVKFALALRDGKLLKSTSMEIMQQWRPANSNSEMGHGLFRMLVPGKGTWLGHSGGVLGFSSGLWWKEDGDCAISMLSNEGVVHSQVTPAVKRIILESNFLDLAVQLAG